MRCKSFVTKHIISIGMNDVLIFLLILSQFISGLYSWLVKTAPTNLSTQLLVRMLTITIGAVSMAFISGKTFTPSLPHILSMGTLNVVHVLSSYYAFSQLPTTVSIPLYYIYPIINVLFSTIFLKTTFSLDSLPWLICSFIGTIIIVFQKGALSFSPSGIVSILVAAITESLIYLAYKSKFEPNEFQGLFHLYFGGLIAVLIGRATNLLEPFDYSLETWKKLTLFNMFVGFIAFSLIAYSIPNMSPELFASLAFFGVLSAHIFSSIGNEEETSIPTMIGTTMIIIGAGAVRYLQNA